MKKLYKSNRQKMVAGAPLRSNRVNESVWDSLRGLM